MANANIDPHYGNVPFSGAQYANNPQAVQVFPLAQFIATRNMPDTAAVQSAFAMPGQLGTYGQNYRLFKPQGAQVAMVYEPGLFRLFHQFSVYAQHVGVETHYFRFAPVDPNMQWHTQRQPNLSAAANNNAIQRRQRLFQRLIELFRNTLPVVTNAFNGQFAGQGAQAAANQIPPINNQAWVQFRMFNRGGGNAAVGTPVINALNYLGGFITPLMRLVHLTLQAILNHLDSVVQSGDVWEIDVNTVFVFTVIRPRGGSRAPRGMWGGMRKLKFNGDPSSSRAVMNMMRDSLCASRALVMLCARFWGTKEDFKLVGRFCLPEQKRRALALHATTGVPVQEKGVCFEDLDKFADALDVQVYVVDIYSLQDRDFCYVTGVDRERKVCLWYEDPDAQASSSANAITGHFDAITKITAIFNCDDYCMSCRVTVDRRREHNCARETCGLCRGSNVSTTLNVCVLID